MYECNLISCPVFEGAGDKSRTGTGRFSWTQDKILSGTVFSEGRGGYTGFSVALQREILCCAVDFSEWHIGKADFIIGFSTTQDHRFLFYNI